METKELIASLKLVKKSIMLGADGGVTDTAWIVGGHNETIVDRIDSMLISLGCSLDELEIESEQIATGAQ